MQDPFLSLIITITNENYDGNIPQDLASQCKDSYTSVLPLYPHILFSTVEMSPNPITVLGSVIQQKCKEELTQLFNHITKLLVKYDHTFVNKVTESIYNNVIVLFHYFLQVLNLTTTANINSKILSK